MEVLWAGPAGASPSRPLHRPGFRHVAHASTREAGNATCCVCQRASVLAKGNDSCESSKSVVEEGAVCEHHPLPLDKAKRLESQGQEDAFTRSLADPDLPITAELSGE